MPWQYKQSTGELTHNGVMVGTGYSGKSIWQNKPAAETFRDQGPIPRGPYRIGVTQAHPTKGSVTMGLTPLGHLAHGRTAFLIHGDSIDSPGNGSEGCIVLGKVFRNRIADSGDTVLVVVE